MRLKTEHKDFKPIIEPQSSRAITEIPTSSIAVGNTIKLNLEKVRGFLADDNVSMVGIWGMGGVGKTTLLNEINNSLQGGDTIMGFKYVIYLVVSKEPQFEKLQKEISEKLGMQSHSKKNDIFEFLKNKDFLLLLDDMWKAVDLPEILGIPLPRHQISHNLKDGGPRYKHKVIFTTREDDVCARMKADKKIEVECLGREEAWDLFKQNADEGVISSNPTIEKLAMKVMEKCSGLPLALKVVGRAMSNKKRPEEWQHMLTSLCKDIKTTPDMEESLFHILKVSYDNLSDETLKECFLSCAQWPEDKFIKVSDLIMYWIGFGLIDDFGNIGEAFDKGYDLIGNLNAACLLGLESSRVAEDYVKLHDVIRDMALWIVSECGKKKSRWISGARVDDLRQSSKWEAVKWKETERILFEKDQLLELLSYENIDEEDQVSIAPTSPRFPNLESLFMAQGQYDGKLVEVSIPFFPYMPSLTYLHLYEINAKVLPKEIRVLVNLRYLNISYTEIHSLPPELAELKELKCFIFRQRMFTTRRVEGLSIISRLPKLQVLDLFGHTCLEADDLSLLKRRVKAIGLHVTSFKTLGLLKDFPTWNISLEGLGHSMPILRFCDLSCKHGGEGLMNLSINDCGFEELLINGSGASLKHIKLDSLSKLKQITWPKTVPSECFQRLTSVSICGCDSLRSLSWVLHLPCLRKLKIQYLAMEELIDPADMQQASSGLTTFPSLQYLRILDMPYLVSLSRCPLDFPALSVLSMFRCPNLKKLPFKPSIVNNKFKYVIVEKKWWKGLEWEDTTIPSHLTKFFHTGIFLPTF
ncbi:putative disease resistance protein At4g10780 [Dioscorea cayenensis subsp. rotundata]|uniref:Disease resistance protein At4g10780 n=1 Tax=Dioscorea cayennensis subsp. rotundata TaxID=55577 RepID=A0AB40CBN1_DIOCR|nr:putative disease resistance protein At4g10780 [Dioscorea cayenensis subsp. rotundata]